MKILKSCLTASIATVCLSPLASSQIISINFAADAIGGGAGGDGFLAAGDIAGVVPVGNWNNTTGTAGTVSNLLDSAGTMTAASVSWSTVGSLWSTNDENDTNQFDGGFGPNHTMMSGYLDYFVGAPGVITFAGLNPALPVNVYLYSLTAVAARNSGEWTATGAIASAPQQAISQIFSNYDPGGPDLTPGVENGGEDGNFLLFPAVLPDATGTITLSSSGLEFRAAANGAQLQIIPEPSAIGLSVLGTLSILGRRRRR